MACETTIRGAVRVYRVRLAAREQRVIRGPPNKRKGFLEVTRKSSDTLAKKNCRFHSRNERLTFLPNAREPLAPPRPRTSLDARGGHARVPCARPPSRARRRRRARRRLAPRVQHRGMEEAAVARASAVLLAASVSLARPRGMEAEPVPPETTRRRTSERRSRERRSRAGGRTRCRMATTR